MDTRSATQQILLHGLVLILAGLVWGIAVPHTPFPRLALQAHIQFLTNGLLIAVMGILLIKLPHAAGKRSIQAMVLAAWLVWLMAISEAANAWWGANKFLSIAAGQANAAGAEPWQELVIGVTHVSAGLSLIVAWALLVIAFARK